MEIELKEELAIEDYSPLSTYFEEHICEKKAAQDEKCVHGQNSVQDELKQECWDLELGIYFIAYVSKTTLRYYKLSEISN